MNSSIRNFLLDWVFQRFSNKIKVKNGEIKLNEGVVKFKHHSLNGKWENLDFGYKKCQIRYGEPNYSIKKFNGKKIIEFDFDLPQELYDYLTLKFEKHAEKDKYGRVRCKHLNSLSEPVVDIIIENMYNILTENGINIKKNKFENKDFVICLTHDIDRLGEDRTLRSKTYLYHSLKNISKLQIKKSFELLKKAFLKGNNDYQIQNVLNLEKRYNANSSWFFLVNRKDADFDINGQLAQTSLKMLKGQEIGLHPSLIQLDYENIQKEKEILSKYIKVKGVRTHYLRGTFPATLVEMEKCRFVYDSTFGFINQYGYRFGTCYPFNVIANDKILKIKEIPQTLMDTQVKDLKIIKDYLKATFEILKTTNSVFVANFHPNRFNVEKYGDLNLKLYKWMLKRGKLENALLTSIDKLVNLTASKSISN